MKLYKLAVAVLASGLVGLAGCTPASTPPGPDISTDATSGSNSPASPSPTQQVLPTSQASNALTPTSDQATATIEPRQQDDSVADWPRYENPALGYSFAYPPYCTVGPLPATCKQSPPEERPAECLCFVNTDDPNQVLLQNFLENDDQGLALATISFVHHDTPAFAPPAGEDLISWLNQQFSYLPGDIPDEPNDVLGGEPAARVYNPGSQQAPSSEELFVMRNGRLFNLSMLDVEVEPLHLFYEQILSTFQFDQ